MKPLKAYQVSDGNDGCCIRFATNGATARREGANELETDWSGIDYCHRKPQFDQYAPGPVPDAVLLADGWCFECEGCYGHVSEDTEDKAFSAAGRPYCCAACMAKDFATQRGRAAAEVAMVEMVEAWLPGCAVTKVYVYGSRLEAGDPGGGYRCCADLTFPGGRCPALWVYGEPGPRVHADDAATFSALYPPPTSD